MMSKKSPYYDAAWPKPIRLGSRSVGWLEHEVIAWIEFRRAESFPREGVRHA
jgi:prophage regulatory protein